MSIWRLIPRRSLRYRARRWLRMNSGLSRTAMVRDDGLHVLSTRGWPLLLFAAVLHMPFVIGLWGEEPPGWLDSSWQVSATLVGLGVAVVVFVLQAAAAQSFSSEVTYRSLLRYTGIYRPAVLALAYLIAVGCVARFGGTGDTHPWAETWALVALILQILLFGVAFARTVDVASPRRVRRVLVHTFAATARSHVKASLLRNVMQSQLAELCNEKVSSGMLFSRGKPVFARRAGFVSDVDCGLPDELDRLGLGERVALTFEPGGATYAEMPLAKLDGAKGLWLEGLIRRSVVVRKRGPAPSPVEVFEELLEVARNAQAGGSPTSLQEALKLLVECMAELPAAHAAWGAEYTAKVVEGFFGSPDRQMVEQLAQFADEAFGSGRIEIVQLIPQAAAGLLHEGLSQNAPLLTEHGASLLRSNLSSAQEIADPEIRRKVGEQISRLSAQAVAHEQYRLEDSDLTLEARLATLPALSALLEHQVRILKQHLDAEDVEEFRYAWKGWQDWAKHWEPENAVEDLELRLEIENRPAGRRAAERELEGARALLKAKRELDRGRSFLVHALGTWAVLRLKEGELKKETWEALVPQLSAAAPSATVVADLLRTPYTNDKLRMVEQWQLTDAPGETGWRPPDVRIAGQFWATLLLIRTMPAEPENLPEIELGSSAPQLGPQVKEKIALFEREEQKWGAAIDAPIDRRCQQAHEVVEKAMQRQREEAEKQLAEADLDPDKVKAFAVEQRKGYEEVEFVRSGLSLAGALVVVVDEDAYAGAGLGQLLPKQQFVDVGQASVQIVPAEHGKELARHHLRQEFEALREHALAWNGSAGLGGALEAITQMRQQGHEPDAVLLPRHPRVRSRLFRERPPQWQWAQRGILQSPAHLGLLDGVPVYETGSDGVEEMVVCALGASLRRIERRPSDSQGPRISVTPIEGERAGELFDAGRRVAGVAEEREDQVAAIRDSSVEMHFEMNVCWERREDCSPIWRVPIESGVEDAD